MVASVELQKAVFQKLSTGVYPVFDYKQLNAPRPHIEIGDEFVLEHNTKTDTGYNYLLTLHTWSSNKSSMEIKTMNDFVLSSIMEGLEVEGFTVGLTTLEGMQILKEYNDTDLSYHGVVEIGIHLEVI